MRHSFIVGYFQQGEITKSGISRHLVYLFDRRDWKGNRNIVYTIAIIVDNNKLYVSLYRAGTFHDANSWHEICCNKYVRFIRVVFRYEIFT